MDLRLAGSVAVVTGASRGLGREIALGFVAEGVQVLAVARSPEQLDRLGDSCSGMVAPFVADMRDTEALDQIVPAALDRFGRIDILVNNAGIAPAAPFADSTADFWREVFDVNVFAPAHLTRSVGAHFIERRRGKVINIGSLSGLRGKPGLSAYSASKGALIRMTEALAAEWAGHDIQVNMIAPGGFATDAQRAVLDDPGILERRTRKIPARRLAEAHEIAALACYLASPLSDFVTGSCYTIDGGELAKL
jgi:2-dehydro-3-deoxy-D-gluconate 5-dehydrogenase